MKIFIIAGEDSGDKLGSAIMDGLNNILDTPPNFIGIGGNGMKSRGLDSIFPMSDLSVMGFIEIFSQYKNLKERMNQTIVSILDEKPDILLTIDAPEFCFRVAKKIKSLNSNIPIVHYVAPSVWAWRSKRAKKITKFIDHLMALFPFEPNYFHDVGLSCEFVGHPIISENHVEDKIITEFKKEYCLKDQPIILCLPGSRKSEINRLMPVFGETLKKFSRALPNAKFILVSTPDVYEHSKQYLEFMPQDIIFLSPEKIGMDKYLEFKKASFKLSNLALAASGTVSLELAANNVPMVIGYDMSPFSKVIIGLMLRTDTVTLVNLICGNRNIPECIGSNFNQENLFLEMIRVYSNNRCQITDFSTTMGLLGNTETPPNVRAANSLIKYYSSFKKA